MKTFTRFFILITFLCVIFHSCSFNTRIIHGNGNLYRKEVSITDFNEILLKISAKIIYHNDSISPPYLQIYADENILPHINVGVVNGRLVVEAENGINLRATNFKIFTNSANLNFVGIEGSGKVELKGEVNAKGMQVDISGSGSLFADSLYCEQAKLIVSGSGNIHLKGVSNSTESEVSGSGNINTLEFSSLDAIANVSGSGNIVLWVGRKLQANVSGSGKIRYRGEPEIKNENISGSGRVSQIK